MGRGDEVGFGGRVFCHLQRILLRVEPDVFRRPDLVILHLRFGRFALRQELLGHAREDAETFLGRAHLEDGVVMVEDDAVAVVVSLVNVEDAAVFDELGRRRLGEGGSRGVDGRAVGLAKQQRARAQISRDDD